MKYLFLFVLAAIVLNSALVLGQEKDKRVEPTRIEQLRASGLEALYNLDYAKAQSDFNEIVKLDPTNPTGPQLLAARVWIKTLYESRRLQSSLYSSESFYTKGDDKVDPKIVSEFRSLTREAKRLADARVKANPRDIEAIDALAAVAGLKASFEEAVERRHFAALRDGSEAVDRHRDVLRLDPNYIDAQLTIGLYEYVLGSLPLPAKLLAGLTGARGSKRRGLAALEKVAREGRWSRDDAKSVLILLYTREKRFPEVLTLARELSAKYPRNYLFRLEAADALVAQAALERRNKNFDAAEKAEQEAFASFDDLLRNRSVRETVSRALDLVHFKYGEVLLTAGQGERAAREFIAATRVERAEPALVTMAHLLAARAFDLIGKRDDALAHYRQVLSRPDIFDSHDGAKKGLRQAFKNDSE
ncbi:MAG: hypothetical protein M3447_03540 [Acidobacteriota bacterium]|nr:hypothetical protein [Acidobacteriota bacterium]